MKTFAKHAATLSERRIKYVLLNQSKDEFLWKDSPIITKEEAVIRMAAFANQTDAEIISIQDSLANTFPRLVCQRKELLEIYHRETGHKFREIIVIKPGFGEKECLAYSYLGELKATFNFVEKTHNPQHPELFTLYDDSAKNMEKLIEYATKATSIQAAPDGHSASLNCFLDIKGGNIKPENRGELYTLAISNDNRPDDILNYTAPNFLNDYKRNLGNSLNKFPDQAIQECITKLNFIKTQDIRSQLEEIFELLVDAHSYLTHKGKLTGIAKKEFAATIILPLSKKNLSSSEKSQLTPELLNLINFLEQYPLTSKASRAVFNNKSLTCKTKSQLELIAEHLETKNRIESGALANFLVEEVHALLKIKK